MVGLVLTVWNALSEEQLPEVAGVIGDAYFDVDDVRYDGERAEAVIPFGQEWDWTPLNRDPEWANAPRSELVSRTRWSNVERVPFMRGEVRIRGVRAFRCDEGAGDAGMLSGMSYDAEARALRVEGVSGDLVAVVDGVDVSIELRPDEIALYVERRTGLGGGTVEKPLWA